MIKYAMIKNRSGLYESITGDGWCPAGGGFVLYPKSEDITVIEKPGPVFSEGFVFVEDSSNPYPAYSDLRFLWNGWVRPMMERHAAERFVNAQKAYANDDDQDTFEWDDEALVVTDLDGEVYRLEPFQISIRGSEKTVYDMSLGYCWDWKATDNSIPFQQAEDAIKLANQE